MKITRKSQLTNVTRTLDLNITEEQVVKYNQGMLIQQAFPNLSADDREFYMTGITDEEWHSMFSTLEEG